MDDRLVTNERHFVNQKMKSAVMAKHIELVFSMRDIPFVAAISLRSFFQDLSAMHIHLQCLFA